MQKAEILSAIRRAARELGRAPSRGELKRLTGVSHYRVLTEFRTLREAIRAAGLEPNKKGERVATEELIQRLGEGEEEAGKKTVADGVCARRTVQRGNVCDAVRKLVGNFNHRGRRGTPRES